MSLSIALFMVRLSYLGSLRAVLGINISLSGFELQLQQVQALLKKGLVQRRAKPYVGDLFLADIGVPARVYKELGVRRPIFREDFIVRLRE